MLTATGLQRSELDTCGQKLVRHDGKQVLVIAHENRVFAIANRCPHEGYPLSEGTIGPGCVLTCNWHNWKFDLVSGAALVGRDPVRTYEVAERGGEILIDFRDRPQRNAALGHCAASRPPSWTMIARAWRAKWPGWDAPASMRGWRSRTPSQPVMGGSKTA
jgi:nitrite reductase/ring-hydroxylating ferredoxin subunit